MKNTIISVGLILISTICIVIMLVLYGQTTRENELQDTLSIAAEQSLENVMFKKNYSINDKDEFIADFVQALAVNIESDTDVDVNVLSADTEKGLLDVEVVEKFKHPNRKIGTITCRKTIALDTTPSDEDTYYLVRFLAPENYKSNLEEYTEFDKYSISGNSSLIIPNKNPQDVDGHKFKGWSLTVPSKDNNYSPTLIEKNTLITKDTTLYAVFD